MHSEVVISFALNLHGEFCEFSDLFNGDERRFANFAKRYFRVKRRV